MKSNVEKVLERDNKLSQLDDRAGLSHIHQLLNEGNISFRILTRKTVSIYTCQCTANILDILYVQCIHTSCTILAMNV